MTIMNEKAVLSGAITEEGVSHTFYRLASGRTAIRIFDVEAQELVGITRYPDYRSGRKAFAEIEEAFNPGSTYLSE